MHMKMLQWYLNIYNYKCAFDLKNMIIDKIITTEIIFQLTRRVKAPQRVVLMP